MNKFSKLKKKVEKIGNLVQSHYHASQSQSQSQSHGHQSGPRPSTFGQYPGASSLYPPPPPRPAGPGQTSSGPSQPPLLVDCVRCKTVLQLPPGALSIACAVCHQLINIAAPPTANFAPPPTTHQPSPVSYQPTPANVSGNKRAVIVGVSYSGTKYMLKGCLNDAKCMKYMLTQKFGFNEQNIVLLTEEAKDRGRIPTKINIMQALYWLMRGVRAGDSLVFHYSGHGSQQKDQTGEEIDGYDETLCPLDFEKNGMIVDDDLNSTLVRPLPPGAKLHAVIDSCHSGTVLDLPYLCKFRHGHVEWEDHRPRRGNRDRKGTSGGEAFCFSGCDDSQTSADTSALSQVTSTGAMTYCFIEAIERGLQSGRQLTYAQILDGMRTAIKIANEKMGGHRSGGVTAAMNILDMFLGANGQLGSLFQAGGLTQIPQLTASAPFDVATKTFSM
ncbi:hypothetical protein CBR_g45219 [Chara braunii]|uniref:Uncharacterized protein n=1 Tax=Chara braunii TaxID=69332 RepID=A0A388K3K4_CHABU|nr:hypothetical protein CBR_g45219 [Chara braunii]|eukprot:GBG64523.1 hypothetical protein CBR_g45219 [Chara braunii]